MCVCVGTQRKGTSHHILIDAMIVFFLLSVYSIQVCTRVRCAHTQPIVLRFRACVRASCFCTDDQETSNVLFMVAVILHPSSCRCVCVCVCVFVDFLKCPRVWEHHLTCDNDITHTNAQIQAAGGWCVAGKGMGKSYPRARVRCGPGPKVCLLLVRAHRYIAPEVWQVHGIRADYTNGSDRIGWYREINQVLIAHKAPHRGYCNDRHNCCARCGCMGMCTRCWPVRIIGLQCYLPPWILK